MTDRWVLVFAHRNPVQQRAVGALKIMLVEEDRSSINDSRWVPDDKGIPNLVANRHGGGKGDVVFADGHVQAVTPMFGLNVTNSNPTF